MSDAGRSLGILRVRPPELTADGPLRPALLAVAAAALGLAPEDAANEAETFLLPAAIDLSPFDASVIDGLTDLLHRLASDRDAVIVDLRFDRTQVRFATVEQLLLAVAMNIASVWVKPTYLVFLVGRLPDPDDDLARILEIPELESFTLFVDDDGNTLGSATESWQQADAVALAATPSAAEERESAKRQARRRRGVFKVATSSRREYAAHKYSLPSPDLSRLLQGYFEATGIKVAILDGIASPWLNEALLAVAAEPQSRVSCFSSQDLEREIDKSRLNMHAELIEALANTTQKVCLVVPMVKQGARLGQLLEVLSTLGRKDVRVLSIFVDSEQDSTDAAEGWASRVRFETPRFSGDVDFFFNVSLRRLLEHDWEVRMANYLGEDVIDESESWLPSRVGLWTMLNELEVTAGYGATDHGVLERMQLDSWDAGWLAECLMRQIDQEPRLSKDNVLMVVPDDETAIGDIADALKTQQGVAVIAIPRAAMGASSPVPKKVAEALQRFRNGEIVLVDESSARYRTMTDLAHVVFKVLQRPADHSLVVFDLPDGKEARPDNLRSILSWRPLDRRGEKK